MCLHLYASGVWLDSELAHCEQLICCVNVPTYNKMPRLNVLNMNLTPVSVCISHTVMRDRHTEHVVVFGGSGCEMSALFMPFNEPSSNGSL